jgi:5-methylcytosine-specific restriction endonuclease McrA
MFEFENKNESFSFDETQTIVSEISDEKSSQIKMIKLVEEINEKTLKEISKLTLEKLKDKCKIFGIQITSKSKKMEIVELLMMEFEKTFISFKNLNKNELKEECKKYKIKGISGLKKEELLSLLINYHSDNFIINLQKNEEMKIEEIQPISENKMEEIQHVQIQENKVTNSERTSSTSLIEELEKQKQEIEKKMLEEIEKQRIELEEKKRQEELERQRFEEAERLRIEEEKQREKEEKKKKKQAIPKNVRNIVWNHYIGEDIIKHRCLCCKKVLITNTNFEVGHVLSEKNGGTHEINNLRPICGACNHSMGTENMIEFVVKYGLYIG